MYMSKDKNINIKITSKADLSAVDKATEKINKFAKENTKTLSSLNKINGSFNLLKGSLGIAVSAVKKVSAAVKDLSASAQKQAAAEKQLETAAKNNPYLNKSSVAQLKEYASELQKIGTVGDEELLPFMAQLAAAGRTQAEIQDIMSAALDVSASGAMSMESAVKNLNKTYSGLSGKLGESIPQIKNLTKEQLKNGDAVKIVAQQYKGMAAEVAKASGSGQQLENEWGDFKEFIGAPVNKIKSSFERVATGFLSKINKGLSKIKGKADEISEEYQEKKEERGKENSYENFLKFSEKTKERTLNRNSLSANQELLTAGQNLYNRSLENTLQLEKDIAVIKAAEAKNSSKKEKKAADEVYNRTGNRNLEDELKYEKQRQDAYAETNRVISERIKIQEQEAAENAKKAEAAALEEAVLAVKNKIAEAYDKEVQSLKNKRDAMAALGDEEAELAYQEGLLSAAQEAAISLINEGNDNITIANSAFQEYKNKVKSAEEAIAKLSAAQETAAGTAKDLSASVKGVSRSSLERFGKEELKETAESLKALKKELENLEQSDIPEDWGVNLETALDNIDEAIEKLNRERIQSVVESLSTMLDTLAEGMSNIDNYFDQYKDAELSEVQAQSESETEALKTQYEEGLISYEDYLKQKEKLDREAAQKEYDIKYAQWQMDLAMASVNAAQATLKALASSSPPMNIINAATAGILGAAQIAIVAANKPVPAFSTGGFLTGSSTRGDKIPFMGNAGEAVLNPAEMRNFMALANGEASGQGISITMPVNIINNAASDTSVSVERQERTLQVTIDRMVNAGFKSGTYTDSMGYAETQKTGARYL